MADLAVLEGRADPRALLQASGPACSTYTPVCTAAHAPTPRPVLAVVVLAAGREHLVLEMTLA
jgi:hypothetical protein